MDRRISAKRLSLIAVVGVSVMATLVIRLWFLQVMAAPGFEQAATGHRMRTIYTEAPRGRILDVNGKVLVDRRQALVVTVDRAVARQLSSSELDRVLAELAGELTRAGFKAKASDLRDRLGDPRYSDLKPVPVAQDVDPELWTVLSERALPGIRVERQWVRDYPYGTVAAHLVGYVGTASQGELDAVAGAAKAYQPGDEIGKAGVEAVMEAVLRGTPEVRRVEIDADGDVVGTVELLQEGRPGDDVVLTVDADAQALAEELLRQQLEAARQRAPRRNNPQSQAPAGSLVVVDPATGGLVVAASHPTFDPRELVFGISHAQAEHLFRSPGRPFLNRATGGEYPAASTFKPFVALAALAAGVIDETEAITDPGRYQIAGCRSTASAGCVFRNAGETAHGRVGLRDSLVVSSDVFYYRIGDLFWSNAERFGRTGIQDMAGRFGFGEALGVDVPSQAAGYLPTPERKAERHESNPDAFPEGAWRTGDNVNIAIGQGDVLITPLQLANAYATLANGGTVHAPRLVSEVRDGTTGEVLERFEPVVARRLDLDPEHLDAVRDALFDVVVERSDQRGTAATAFAGFDLGRFPVAGKTGTAQVDGKADNSMFAAFGPWPAPRYAAAAVLEQAGFGGEAAAPAVRQLFEALAGLVPMPSASTVAGADTIDAPTGGDGADGEVEVDVEVEVEVEEAEVEGSSARSGDDSRGGA